MERKYNLRMKRVKIVGLPKSPHTPDFHSIVKLSKTYFTITAWFDDTTSDLSCVLEEITPERLSKDKYLRKEYSELFRC